MAEKLDPKESVDFKELLMSEVIQYQDPVSHEERWGFVVFGG